MKSSTLKSFGIYVILMAMMSMTSNVDYYGKSTATAKISGGETFHSQNLYTSISGDKITIRFKVSSFLGASGKDMPQALKMNSSAVVVFKGELPSAKKSGQETVDIKGKINIDGTEHEHSLPMTLHYNNGLSAISLDADLDVTSICQSKTVIRLKSQNIELVKVK